MTTSLFEYPKSAAFDRVLPKSKIYEHARPSSAVKELFVSQVKQVSWQYKLAPATLNLKGTDPVPEIQIFKITLKETELKSDVLRCIDKAIPFPILFELHSETKVKASAAYKRPSEADITKWVLSGYFHTEWAPINTKRKPLPLVFDLEALYTHLLAPLMPFPARPGENLQEQVERMESIRSKQREMEKCEARLRKEKQFNRKVAINSELRGLSQELQTLTCQ